MLNILKFRQLYRQSARSLPTGKLAWWTDEELNGLRPGGHDPVKIYNAYQHATEAAGPVVILAQTVKGYLQGDAGEASNVSHQTKKMKPEALKAFRSQLEVPLEEEQLESLPYFRFDQDSPEF